MALWLRSYSKEVVGGKLASWTRATPTGKQLVCDHCSRCGTRLFHQRADQLETMSIKPGTLDAPLDFEPVARIWTSSAQKWLHLPSAVLSYPENPPSFDEIFVAWKTRTKK